MERRIRRPHERDVIVALDEGVVPGLGAGGRVDVRQVEARVEGARRFAIAPKALTGPNCILHVPASLPERGESCAQSALPKRCPSR